MIGFIIGMSIIVGAVLLGERFWVWIVHRLEQRASNDTSWAYEDCPPVNGNGKAHG